MTQAPPATIGISQIDSARFGFTVARADQVTVENLSQVMEFCGEARVRVLFARCPADDLAAVQAMAASSFRFMDAEVHYRGGSAEGRLETRPGVRVRPLRPADLDAVLEVAGVCFKNFDGHYHADSRLDRVRCDEVYQSWTHRCCTGEAADTVLVVELEGRIAGFSAFRRRAEGEGQLALGAVAPWASGRRLYGELTIAGKAWCRERHLDSLMAITQLGNLRSQRTWARLGMTPTYSAYTFHRWFD